jgi:hypothetical protein
MVLSPADEAGGPGVDAVYDEVDAVDGAVLGEGLARLGTGLAEACKFLPCRSGLLL